MAQVEKILEVVQVLEAQQRSVHSRDEIRMALFGKLMSLSDPTPSIVTKVLEALSLIADSRSALEHSTNHVVVVACRGGNATREDMDKYMEYDRRFEEATLKLRVAINDLFQSLPSDEPGASKDIPMFFIEGLRDLNLDPESKGPDNPESGADHGA